MNDLTEQERELARRWCDQHVLGEFKSDAKGVLLLPSTKDGHPGLAMSELFDRVALGLRGLRNALPIRPTFPRWRHRRTCCVYLLISDNVLRENDLRRFVTYQDTTNGQIWSRPYNEFFDGRFELITDEEKEI